jgi:hypothetical protein
MSLDSKIEKEPGKWELVDGSERDKKDLLTVDKSHYSKEAPYNSDEELEFPAGCGMLLREGGSPIGYILFDIDQYDNKRVLYVPYLFIIPEKRSPVHMVQLIQQLRTYAREQNVTHIGWSSGSPKMDKIARRLDPNTNGVLLPIEEFGIDTFARTL